MFHRVTIIGRVGQDPEMRYTPDGTPVCTLSVATTNYIGKSTPNGERPCPKGWKESYNGKGWEVTTWWRISCWRGLAETVNNHLSKGRQVFVEGEVKGEAVDGKLNPRVWTGNDGVAKASFELTARFVKFLGGKGEGGAPVGEPPPEGFEDSSDEPLPF
ncbi:single-stranded DNA-binding protein [Chloroflexota bacterium]